MILKSLLGSLRLHLFDQISTSKPVIFLDIIIV